MDLPTEPNSFVLKPEPVPLPGPLPSSHAVQLSLSHPMHPLARSGVTPADRPRRLNQTFSQIRNDLQTLKKFAERSSPAHTPKEVEQCLEGAGRSLGEEATRAMQLLNEWSDQETSAGAREEQLGFYLLLKMYVTQAHFHVSTLKIAPNALYTDELPPIPDRTSFRNKLLKGRNSVFKDTEQVEEAGLSPGRTDPDAPDADPLLLELVGQYDDLTHEANDHINALREELRLAEGADARKRHAVFCCGRRIVCVD